VRRHLTPGLLALVAILGGALAIRLYGLKHGLPFIYHSDESQHFTNYAVEMFGGSLNPHYFQNPANLLPRTAQLVAAADTVEWIEVNNEIDALMNRDIGEYHRPWRATGVSASDRRMQIMRELGNESPAKPSAVDVRTEVRKLEQLRGSDPQMFQFGSWPGARSPAERLAAIQQGRD